MNKSSNDKKIDEQTVNNKRKKKLLKRIKSSKFMTLFQKKAVQKYLFITISAIVVGLAFGFVTLNVLNHVGQQKGVDAVTTDQLVDHHEQNETLTLPAIRAFVIQGGVFSSETNLHEWQKRFLQSGVETVTWEKDELHYLFIGIAQSEAELLPFQQSLTDEGFDTYVKEWIIEEKIVSVPKEDVKWLELFITIWQKALMSSDEQLQKDMWDELIHNELATSDFIELLQKTVQQLVADEVSKQYALLIMLHEFDHLLLSER